MNKTAAFLIFFLILSVPVIKAQEEMGFDSKFAAGGGFTPGWIVLNPDAVNEKLAGFGTDKFPASGMFATGGTGYISIPFIENVRIGGMGLGGSMSAGSVKDGLRKEAVYSVRMGGFTIEYTFPFIKSVAVSAGGILGGGSNTIELYQNNAQYNWNRSWQELSDTSGSAKNLYRKFKNYHFAITPTINVDIPFYRFAAFRIGGGYKFALGNNWVADNDQPLNNTPSNLNSNVFFLQAGIFIGFFNY
ncbi:MAG: hypothetical protein WCJ01_03135 [Ignavibacteria bacterium]